VFDKFDKARVESFELHTLYKHVTYKHEMYFLEDVVVIHDVAKRPK